MNSDRPYRKALSREEVLAELEKVRNTQLSGEIVDVFLGLLKKRPDLWER
jgi:HD-GYP domain-containing protein (c-di-GMP phosphodiesterase class II)